VGADWPLRYGDLRPYYAAIEQELPVAGEHWPWGDPHGYPHRPHPFGGNGEIFLRGADKLGITAKVGPPDGRLRGEQPLEGRAVAAQALPEVPGRDLVAPCPTRFEFSALGGEHHGQPLHELCYQCVGFLDRLCRLVDELCLDVLPAHRNALLFVVIQQAGTP
jgi:hypothetical protein